MIGWRKMIVILASLGAGIYTGEWDSILKLSALYMGVNLVGKFGNRPNSSK